MVQASLGFGHDPDPRHRLFDPALGGGAMLDLGVYGLSLAVHFLGPPSSVAARGIIGSTGVDEQVVVSLEFRAIAKPS